MSMRPKSGHRDHTDHEVIELAARSSVRIQKIEKWMSRHCGGAGHHPNKRRDCTQLRSPRCRSSVHSQNFCPHWPQKEMVVCFRSSLKKGVMWHICWRQKLWSQQRQPLLGTALLTCPLLGNNYVTCNNELIRKWCSLRHPCRQLHDATKEELLGEVFSMWSVPMLHKELTVCCELVQVRSCWTWKTRTLHCWKLLPSSAVRIVAENTSLCVIVICKV
jgi:hypothetical protein